MTEELVEEVSEIRTLDAHDRCDQCGTQAYVSVVGLAGELLFCAHHFSNIERDASAYSKIQSFSYVISDQRDKLSDKRAGL